jgi:hypothetical protein
MLITVGARCKSLDGLFFFDFTFRSDFEAKDFHVFLIGS